MKLVLILALAVLIAGCGKSDGGSAAPTSKPFASMWVRDTDGALFDLTSVTLGTTQYMGFTLAEGTVCRCTLMTAGTEASGNYSITSCAYESGSTAGNCALPATNGTFTKTDTVLSLCPSSASCVTFQ